MVCGTRGGRANCKRPEGVETGKMGSVGVGKGNMATLRPYTWGMWGKPEKRKKKIFRRDAEGSTLSEEKKRQDFDLWEGKPKPCRELERRKHKSPR